jgi:hypothetical protein
MAETVFIAQRVSDRRNVIFPDKLIIDEHDLTYYKGKLIGYIKTNVTLKNIASVTIIEGVLFGDISIETFGGDKIIASGFLKSDARRIKELLT